MFKSGFILSTEAHLDAAIFNKSDEIVWLQGRIVDYGGKIETYTENSVTVNGEKYMKTMRIQNSLGGFFPLICPRSLSLSS
jgi:hypothetical protein